MLSAEEFVRLRQSERSEDYLRATTENAEIDVWLEIINQFPSMRIWVAQNKTVPMEILSMLARDEDPAVRAFVAMKNKLSVGLFKLLAADSDNSVRNRIAHNKNAPVEVLRDLANDSDEDTSSKVRERLASL